MTSRTITSNEFIEGTKTVITDHWGRRRHHYLATMRPDGIEILDTHGHAVVAQYAATTDMRTVYVFLPNIGYIGGWQYPHRHMPWKALIESINRGILYERTQDLPKRYYPIKGGR